MNEQNVDIDYCGIIILLRQLLQSGKCTEKEVRKIAARIAARNGVSIIVFP